MSENEDKQRENALRYKREAHRMQAGVAFKMNFDPTETTPKHLRVGINTAMSDHGALAQLLIDKGIISRDEYAEYLVRFMKQEADAYEKEVDERMGGGQGKIKLGSLYES